MRSRTAVALLFAAALFFPTLRASAVGTRTFELDTIDKLSGGDLKGVSIGSDGIVRAGWTLGTVRLEGATGVLCALPMDDDSVLVGVSPAGKILRVAADQATTYAETGKLAVLALAKDAKGTVYAAGTETGTVFKIVNGKAEVFAKLEDADQVLALAFDKAGKTLYASTSGDESKVFRIEPSGTSTVYFKSTEPMIVSLAVADNGDVYAGSSGKALLFRITSAGRATVVYDAPGEDIKALAFGSKGALYALNNEYTEGSTTETRRSGGGRGPAGPSVSARMRPGKGTLWRIDSEGRPEKMMHHDEFHYFSLAMNGDTPYIGTGGDGRVYSVDDAHVVTLVADPDSKQVPALGFLPKSKKPFVVAGDPAVFHRLAEQGGPASVWTSKALDAGLRARFGHLSWRGNGLELQTRTGNTATPDGTWSPWSNPITAPGLVASPPGRFVQVRARWTNATATLGEVSLPFVTVNMRPVVLDVTARQRNAAPGTHEGLAPSGGEPPKHDSTVRLTWKVDNPDGDQLRYRVWYRREDQPAWRDVLRADDVLTKTDYDWDTLALPEGKYRLRVEASDELSNPPDQVMRHALESSSFLVDNTPPVFPQPPTMQGRRLRGRVVDGLGPIVRVEISVDGRNEWRPVAPGDGIFDTNDEAFDSDVTALVAPGSHLVAVRAFDAAGNAVTVDIEAR
jgi:hypothetical protein